MQISMERRISKEENRREISKVDQVIFYVELHFFGGADGPLLNFSHELQSTHIWSRL